jgi:dTDP-4-dehydrorhamnose reductase
MLGRAVANEAARNGIDLVRIDRHDVDLAAEPATWMPLPHDVSHVINCAAWTDVDDAEAHPDLADRVNGHAVLELARRSEAVRAKPVFISTDYVFSGRARFPCPVDAPREPLNAYGRSKALGESLLEDSGLPFLCIRTSWLYAAWSRNFVLTLRDLMRTRDTLKVVDDQRGRPTSVSHLAALVHEFIRLDVAGFVHGCDGGSCTWFGFAREIARHVGYRGELIPCTSAAFPRPAVRPAYSVLDLVPTESLVGPREDWTLHLERVLSDLFQAEHSKHLVQKGRL